VLNLGGEIMVYEHPAVSTIQIEVESLHSTRAQTSKETLYKFIKEMFARREELAGLLTKIESYSYAKDEIRRSIATIHKTIDLLEDSALPMNFVETISSFMPINQPLYGLVIFALIPSLYARSVFVRPAKDTNDIANEIYKVLNLEYYWPNVYIKNITRRSFLEQSVSISDVVVFVGRYHNAEIVRKYITTIP
jgi:acyl-CoA reductase-like NAD-dependent aldehyde dehydrogenase